jgi:23S rRNA (adenine2030-N6)-methyltransferase
VYLAWYPIKDPRSVARFHDRLATVAAPRLLGVELLVRRPVAADRLNGCGLIVANPPHTLHDELAGLLPEIAGRLGSGDRWRLWPIAADGTSRKADGPQRGKRSTA